MSTSTITVGGQSITLVSTPSKPGLRSVEFDYADAVGTVPSKFTGQVQAQKWLGADMLSGTMTLPPLTQVEADDWIAFLMQLRGMANAFQIGDPLQPNARGSGAGAPVVDNTVPGGNAAGSEFLGTQGWTANATGVLLRGDWIQVGYRRYRVMDDVNADGSGKAIFEIWPVLREVPDNDGTTAGWLNATGTCNCTVSKSIGNGNYGIIWQNFVIPDNVVLPSDAVIQGIYPVLICSATHDQAFSYYLHGVGLSMGSPGGPGFTSPSDPSNTTFSSTEFHAASIGTSLSDLVGQEIMTLINSSLNISSLADVISITGVGFAIYYTTATHPGGTPQMPAPFTVPSGQAVAWALPMALTETGVQPGSGGIFGSGTGEGVGTTATYNGGLILNGAKGLFRLAQNKRVSTADITRLTKISFPIQEYR